MADWQTKDSSGNVYFKVDRIKILEQFIQK